MRFARAAVVLFATLLPSLAAGEETIVYQDDFQRYAMAAVPGWVDSYVSQTASRRRAVNAPAASLYRASLDPLAAGNIAYGSRGVAAGEERGIRSGTFSTLTTVNFAGRVEYRGRFFRERRETGAGVAFFSSYPETDSYYVLAVEPLGETARLFAHASGEITGRIDTGVRIDPLRWYGFAVVVDATGTSTSIQARVWPDGGAEPAIDSIEAVDSGHARLRGGRIGMWSGGSGLALIDDLTARSAAGSSVDTQPPVIRFFESGTELDPARPLTFVRPVAISISVADESAVSYTAMLDGHPYTSGDLVGAAGSHALRVSARDAAGNEAEAVLTFSIAPPAGNVSLSITTPAAGSVEAAAHVTVRGVIANAVAVEVDGVRAEIDAAGTTFIADVPLLEGENQLTATATGPGGTASDSVRVVADTRAPDLAIVSPADGACIDAAAIEVRGRAADRDLKKIVVAAATTTVEAAIHSDGTWTTTLPAPAAENLYEILVQAADGLGHVSIARSQIRVDRTTPAIDLSDSGRKLADGIYGRALSPLIKVVDADPAPVVTATLDSQPYVIGSLVASEGSHTLAVIARDCAGHSATASIHFTVDTTPPALLSIAPSNGTTFAGDPPIAGTASPDAVTVTVQPSGRTYPVENGRFTLAGLPLAEGMNELTLRLIDGAGNGSDQAYNVSLKSVAPGLVILEQGSAIPDNALFNRAVVPTIDSSDPTAAVAAVLNGQPFTSGTSVTADGVYVLEATARDVVGHSSHATVRFSIDRTPPSIAITAPPDGSTVSGGTAEVRGTIVGNAVALSVNGAPVPFANGAFSSSVPLDGGPNTIVAIARDAAGNSASAQVRLSGGPAHAGLIVTSPPDGLVTNRRTILVSGQVLTPVPAARVTINDVEVSVDPAGSFRKVDFPVTDGANAVVVTLRDGLSGANSVTSNVTVDRTPPNVRILESGQPLADGSRFPSQALITVDASDGGTAVQPAVFVDGEAVPLPLAIGSPGGHLIAAMARDRAGNETRIERTLFIGTNGPSGCSLADFDPPSGAVVTSSSVTITGQCGGAAGVKVNGVAAYVASGGFCATVELPQEGENAIAIACTDLAGNATGAAASLTLRRVTNQPSASITAPEEGSETSAEAITVVGTVANASSVEVNGSPAMIAGGGTFTAAGVRLADGTNTIVVRARNEAGRIGYASRRIVYLKDPPALTVTSPMPDLTTGASRIDVSGTWRNVDPSTIAAAGVTAQSASRDDTSGTFVVRDVPLTAGPQVVAVTARDRLGRTALTTVAVTVTPGRPSISIAEPADGAVFGSAIGAAFTVRGTFAGSPGSTVECAGVPATIDAASSTFTASVPFTSAAGGVTPVIARLTAPDGVVTIDSIRVMRLTRAPSVIEAFPAANAAPVEPGALLMVLFSAPMDRASLSTAFHLETSGGVPVTGLLRLDGEVLTFAPAALLTAGGSYTMRISASAHDVGGNALAADYVSAFTVAATASETAPSIAPLDAVACAGQREIRGTAPAGSRVRLDYGPLTLTSTASAAGAFVFQLPLSGRSGCQVARVRTVGSDGSLSPAAEVRFQVDCAGLQVTGAAYDRAGNRLTITFSRAVDVATLTSGSVQLRIADGRSVSSTASLSSNTIATITPAENLSHQSFTLTVTTAVADMSGGHLASPYSQAFPLDDTGPPVAHEGTGVISGEVYDGSTDRPLSGATVAIDALSITTDDRGRYTVQVPEGPHAIRGSAAGFAKVWREVIVPAGAAMVPIDIRLPRQGKSQTVATGDFVIRDGGTNGTAPVELRIPAGSLAAGAVVTLTSVGAQSLPGLLPLGWSPMACASIEAAAEILGPAELAFDIPLETITTASQSLVAVRYRNERDDWLVVSASPTFAAARASLQISAPGTYALVYPDRASALIAPPAAVSGLALRGVADPCAATPCPLVASKPLELSPSAILPTGSSFATLSVAGNAPAIFPSGTAVQATIDEDLELADGTHVAVAPFSVDLLLYRTPDGALATAEFAIAPSAKAAQVVLRAGVDHIRILPYSGRLERGTLIGPEGGSVPGDGSVTVEIAPGASVDPLRATSAAITDLAPFGAIAGFQVIAGFNLMLQRSTKGLATELAIPARVHFPAVRGAQQHVVVEVLDDTPFGRMFRVVAETAAGPDGIATKAIDPARLPLDGIVREGQYLLLAADAPIAFATGHVRVPASAYVANARVISETLGTADLTRAGGAFTVPVPAKPAAPFALVPRSRTTGDGIRFTSPSAPDADVVVGVGDLLLVLQPPLLISLTPADAASGVDLGAVIKATFAPAIDPQSVNPSSIVVTDRSSGLVVPGAASAEGTAAIVWTMTPGVRLLPSRTYSVAIAPTVRGTNGAPFGRSSVTTFSTIAVLANGEVHPEKIHVTIPDGQGHSRVIGDSSALPAAWNAVVVRRGRDFTTRPQATAASDGAFAIEIGERVALSDQLDLQVINSAGAIAAILPLTPFVRPDGGGFIAPADRDTRFITPDGKIVVEVPEGAFDEPTEIAVAPAASDSFSAVPSVAAELRLGNAVRLDFQGTAKKRIEVTLPAAPDAASTPYFLGRLGESVRGPRVEIVDILRTDAGRLTTAAAESGRRQSAAVLTPGSAATFPDPNSAKNAMVGANRPGIYSAVAFPNPVSWLVVDVALGAAIDLFASTSDSLFVSAFSLLEKHGRALIPVPANKPFQLVGYDTSTGLETFRVDHAATGPLDPLNAAPAPISTATDTGPYPLFVAPGRVELVTVPADGAAITSIRGIRIESAAGLVNITGVSPQLPATQVSVVNLSTAAAGASGQLGAGWTFSVPAAPGDRLVVSVAADDVDPEVPVEVAFSSPLGVTVTSPEQVDAFLHSNHWVDVYAGEALSELSDVTSQARFGLDATARRLVINLPLQRGRWYRVVLRPEIAGPAIGTLPGLKLGQRLVGSDFVPASPKAIQFDFRTRTPGGTLDQIALPPDRAGIRDMALAGNVALLATTSGGLQAFDISNPAAMSTTPINRVAGEFWSVAADRHGRVFAADLTGSFGVLHSYRMEDFTAAGKAVKQTGSGIVSWRPGVNFNLPVGSETLLVDRPEAYPRKIQLLVQDDESTATRAKLLESPHTVVKEFANGLQLLDVSLSVPSSFPYWSQRITVENRTLGGRWSADIPRGQSGWIRGIVAGPDDDLLIARNTTTYGVLSLFGYGIGVFDLNAMESNDQAAGAAGYTEIAERILLTAATGEPRPDLIYPSAMCGPDAPPDAACTCSPEASAPNGLVCEIRDLTFSPEALILPATKSSAVSVLAVEQRRGLLDIEVTPPATDPGPPPVVTKAVAAAAAGLSLSEPFFTATGLKDFYHPRLRTLHDLIASNSQGTPPVVRFTSIAPYLPSGSQRTYALLAANGFGVLVIDAATPLDDDSLADVIWIPAGATSVRVIPRSDLAVVVDGAGRVLLVDLKRIDERSKVKPSPTRTDKLHTCTNPVCAGELFPTAATSVAAPHAALPPDADWIEVGVDDPRIVWKSEPKLVRGTLPPLIDPETGILLTGDMDAARITTTAATDPGVAFTIRTPAGSQHVSSIIPLGIAPATSLANGESPYAAFRLEVSLPGAVTEALAKDELRFAVESEAVAGAETAQAPQPLPPAHLRQTTRSGAADPRAAESAGFRMERLLPYDASDPQLARLRYQRGFNRFVSPWIVAIADPRASERYVWPKDVDPALEGCDACRRPASLQPLKSPAVFEMLTRGRFIAARPESKTFSGTKYEYLETRLGGRVSTVMADIVRPPDSAFAAQNAPVAGGALLETTWLHSGEVGSSAVDLDAGGRNGFDVIIDRTYGSRSIGVGPLAAGWDSSIFRRLRPLPTGDVEYRDGAGAVWTFRLSNGLYASPPGLFLALTRTERGWTLRDQKNRLSNFDELGRLTREADEYFDTGSGNAIDYLYDASGQLSTITDPVGRRSTLQYDADGFLRSIGDWRTPARVIDYVYDGLVLKEARLPEVANVDNVRPTIRYAYDGATLYKDRVELGTNLTSVTEPHEVATQGKPRVSFQYGQSGPDRDRVKLQTWGSGDSAGFSYMAGPQPGAAKSAIVLATVDDALHQARTYTIAGFGSEAHVTDVVEAGVPTAKTPFGELPTIVNPTGIEAVVSDRHWSYSYYPDGLLKSATLEGITSVSDDFVSIAGVPGRLPHSSTTADAAGQNAITRKVDYAGGAFVKGVSAGALSVESPEPTRSNAKSGDPLVATNDSIAGTAHFDPAGRLSNYSSNGGTVEGAGEEATYAYKPDGSAQLVERGELATVNRGGLITTFMYSGNTITAIEPRDISTTTTFDSWRRPITVSTSGPDLTSDLRIAYDATGRVAWREERKGDEYVRTTFAYDEIGRQKSVTLDKVAVDGVPSSVTTSWKYDLAKRVVETTLPTGGTITRELDGIGRVAREVTTTGAKPIERRYAYDALDHPVFATDLKAAMASAFDVHGREIATLNPDGSSTNRTFDDWGRSREVKSSGKTSGLIEQQEFEFTAAGRLRTSDTAVESGVVRHTDLGWDGAGRTAGAAVGNRAVRQSFDHAGRLLSSATGEGTVSNIVSAFVGTSYSSHTGWLPQTTEVHEKSGAPQSIHREYDTFANVSRSAIGSLEWRSRYDELGNLVMARPPGRPETTYSYDGRGSLEKESMPGGAENRYRYDASGVMARYLDPSQPAPEETRSENDLLGRPLKRVYPDTTTEVFTYDGSRLAAYTDRQGRTRTFSYDSSGRLSRIDRQAGSQLDQLDYDDAGRLVAWTNRDSRITWENFNLDGRPRLTTLTIYRNGTGFSTHDVVGEFRQEHLWNEYGERSEWTMPRPAGFTTKLPWTDRVREHRDALGNITGIDRLLFGSAEYVSLLTADYRNAGRPDVRTVNSACGSASCVPASIVRKYGYDETTGMADSMTVTSRSIVVAGSRVTAFDGTQISAIELAGISNGSRTSSWTYDERSRLDSTSAGRTSQQTLSSADFRQSLTRTPRFDDAARTQLEKANVDVSRLDAPSQTAGEAPGHKIEKITIDEVDAKFSYNGAERTGDGSFTYEWDENGRLIRATENPGTPVKPAVMRTTYTYDGNDRMITRRVESALSSSMPLSWQLAKPDVITDGLPAEAIFVWDPISDRIAAVFDASTLAVSRQIIQGGNGYDDPIEVTLTEPAGSSKIDRLYPLYDEAATSNLQAVLNANGEIVSRKVMADAFGDETFSIGGAAIDKVDVTVAKNSAGEIASVDISMRSTEELQPSSIDAGMRLAANDSNGKTLRTSTATPVLTDAFTITTTMTSEEWSSFVDGATSISIAATPSLRASAWGSAVPVLPAPAWATATLPVSSAAYPVEVRESISDLTARIAAIPSSTHSSLTLYEVPDLALLGTPDDPSRLLVHSYFQALPFSDSTTHLIYVRARWLDPATGTWLTPDPMGYRDSANLYAFCAGDPVNCKDPRGEDAYDEKQAGYIKWYGAQIEAMWQKRQQVAEQIRQRRNVTSDTGLLESEDRLLAQQMMTFGGTPDNAVTFFDAARARGDTSVLVMAPEGIHGALVADEGVRNIGAAVITAFGPHVARRQGVNWARTWLRAREFLDDAIDTYNNAWISSEVGAIGKPNRARVRSRPARPIVIGETMVSRVEPAAKVLGAHTFQPRSSSTDPMVWKYNQRRWIRRQIQSGGAIYDIDIDPSRPVRSEYYAIEQSELAAAGLRRMKVGTLDVDVPSAAGTVKKTFHLFRWIH